MAETQDKKSIPRVKPLAELVDSERFQFFIGGVIVLNAVVLGLQTYAGIENSYGSTLTALTNICYAVFLVELVIRIASYGKRPWNFFRSGWNVFDFIVIGGALVPAVREQATILRLLRLARVARLMRFLPDARVLILTITRATPSVISMVVLTILILFIYGILGWTIFGEALPEQWGDIGVAMLTLFILLTLEDFPDYLAAAQEVSPFATAFFLSYILVAAFVVVNLLIGIVIGAMERARDQEAAEARKQGDQDLAGLLVYIAQVKETLNTLESQVESLQQKSAKSSTGNKQK